MIKEWLTEKLKKGLEEQLKKRRKSSLRISWRIVDGGEAVDKLEERLRSSWGSNWRSGCRSD